jgi:hypothetical protein
MTHLKHRFNMVKDIYLFPLPAAQVFCLELLEIHTVLVF